MSHREVGSSSIQGTSSEASQGQGHGEACAVGVVPTGVWHHCRTNQTGPARGGGAGGLFSVAQGTIGDGPECTQAGTPQQEGL